VLALRESSRPSAHSSRRHRHSPQVNLARSQHTLTALSPQVNLARSLLLKKIGRSPANAAASATFAKEHKQAEAVAAPGEGGGDASAGGTGGAAAAQAQVQVQGGALDTLKDTAVVTVKAPVQLQPLPGQIDPLPAKASEVSVSESASESAAAVPGLEVAAGGAIEPAAEPAAKREPQAAKGQQE
jgi:uncharacterized membrane protein